MQVHILEPQGTIWQGMSKKVILPALGGEICVLDFHQPFFIRLKKGYIRLAQKTALIKDGLAFMHGNELQVFVER